MGGPMGLGRGPRGLERGAGAIRGRMGPEVLGAEAQGRGLEPWEDGTERRSDGRTFVGKDENSLCVL